jgi:hypothetical protein
MSTIIAGVVKNGVIVPNSPLAEGTEVEIRVQVGPEVAVHAARVTPAELRRMPREQRQSILAAAAKMAEHDYRFDSELTGFDAFSEEERDDDEPDSR